MHNRGWGGGGCSVDQDFRCDSLRIGSDRHVSHSECVQVSERTINSAVITILPVHYCTVYSHHTLTSVLEYCTTVCPSTERTVVLVLYGGGKLTPIPSTALYWIRLPGTVVLFCLLPDTISTLGCVTTHPQLFRRDEESLMVILELEQIDSNINGTPSMTESDDFF